MAESTRLIMAEMKLKHGSNDGSTRKDDNTIDNNDGSNGKT